MRSVGETTSDMSTTTERKSPLTGREEGDAKDTENERAKKMPQSQLSVLSWEQLSCYEGFKPLNVQAGLQASLRMFVLHTHQVFLRETKNYDELMCQVCNNA